MEQHVETVVVGAGITGLVAGWLLARHGHDVLVLEASDRAGGLVRTTRREGYLLEHGPFTVLPKSPVFRRIVALAAPDLDVVLADRRAKARRFVLQHGRLVAIHGRAGPLTTRLYGPKAKMRLLRGLVWSRPGPIGETTIEEAVKRRFGPEFARWAVDPLIRGIVAGDIGRLSLPAMFPALAAFDRRTRSPLAAIMRRGKTGGTDASPATTLDDLLPLPASLPADHLPRRAMISFREGLAALTDWLARPLGDRLLRSHQVERVERSESFGRYRLLVKPYHGATGRSAEWCHITCRHLILTTSATVTRHIVSSLVPAAAAALQRIAAASLVVVHAAFDARRVPRLPDGFGFLVPSFERNVNIMGTLFASRTFPHHAPEGKELLRIFLGGRRDPAMATRDQDEIVVQALDGIRGVLGVEGMPELIEVDRFAEAIPQYEVGHAEILSTLDQAVASHQDLILAGSYRDGVSVNDRIDAGFRAASNVLAVNHAVR